MSTRAQTASAPRFSIVVPAFQAAATLGETLDAILAQTFTDWECIVVDDGSTDETLVIASSFANREPRIRVIHQDNAGSAGAYNTGVSTATGRYVVICSADDILLRDHLSSMSAFIDAEVGYDIYSSNGYFWRPGVSRNVAYDTDRETQIHSQSLADVIQRCFFSVGAAYRRELFASVGGYRLGVYGEDYDFWLRAMASGARHRYLPKPLALHRVSASQKSARLDTVFRSDIRLVSDLRRDFPLSEEEDRAVDKAIADRERLIAQVNPPWRFVPEMLRPGLKWIAVALIGRDRARRIAHALQSRRGGPND